MKNVLTMRKDKVMKQYTKYICVFLMMIGISTSAWGTTPAIDETGYSISVDAIDYGTIDPADYTGEEFIEINATVTITKKTGYPGNITVSLYPGTYYYISAGADSKGYCGYEVGDHTVTITTFFPQDEVGVYEDVLLVYISNPDDYVEIPITATVGSACSTSPTVTAGSYSTVRSTTATVSCSSGISSLGSAGCSISSYGFVIGTATGPTIGGSGVTKHQVGTTYTSTGVAFSKDLTGLNSNTTYYVRPYATNGNGTAYGTQTSFTTLQRYTITYYKNDGGATSDVEYKDHGVDYTISSNKYSRSGYTLVKWHTLAAGTGGTDYAKGASYTGNAALSLHAVWGGTISYNNNGGSGSMDAAVVVSGGSYELPSCTFTPPSGKKFKCWAQGAADGTERAVGYSHTVAGDITFYAVWRDEQYTDYKFSCADWSVTGPSADTVFITSTASKTVRSQEAFHVTASGLPASTALTFTTFPANTRFAFKAAGGSALTTDTYGKIDEDFYVFYTPTSDDTSDGLDEITKIYVSVSGEPRKDTLGTKTIIGRHLPTNFVIAAKKNGKWWALPSDMTTSNPSPVEIAVDDDTNPSIAYTVTTNIYSIAQPAASEYIRLKMNGQSNYPLFGSATGSTSIGKSSQSNPDATPILDGYLWKLVQKRATGLSNPQEAKYLIYCKNHSTNHLRLKATDQWGLYDSGVEELRLIPASESTVVNADASIVAWGKKGAIIEAKKPYDVNAFYIVGKLPGGIKSDTIVLRETETSKGTGTRYNFTVDFGSDFDFSASEGQMLTLEWFNILKTLKAVSNVTVPRIVASNTTINSTNYPTKSVWNTEVHVLPEDTLTIDASGYSTKNKDVTIKELNIYPGAAVIINKDTLKATNLVLRSGWSRIGEKIYAVGSLYINPGTGNGSLKSTNAYMDWYIDYDQYYPIAVPWKVATSSISYKNMVVDIDQGLIVRYYDGERHAKGGDGNTNWKQYSWATNMPTHLVPGIGYAITARRPAGKAFSIIRMPLTIPSADWTKNGEQGVVSDVHKDEVDVTAWVKDEGETPDHAKGWNFIANPYMCNYEGDITHEDGDEYNIAYVNIPDVNFKEFDQVEIGKATLKPGSGFLIQTEKTGTLTFGTSNRKASAPSYLAEVPKASKQKAYITLSGDDAEDEMGLIISERYTAEYEINADLEKLLSDGNTLRTYMIYNNINMAYVAINEELAKEWIPVTVRIPATGEYTFSLHEASKVSELEGIYLIDYTNNIITNLIENNYSFMATEGTIAGRFAINAIVGKHDTPTDIDIINAGGDIKSNQPFKFIYNDKVFILHNGIIYDSTGKKVREINK